MELAIALLLIGPAVALALGRSTYLIDYAIWLLALNRGVRRLVDYFINQEFNPYSVISLTPLVVGGLLFLVALTRTGRLQGRPRMIFVLIFTALASALAVGLVRNGFGAIYSLGEWISGLGAMLFAATHGTDARIGDRWLRSAGWAGMFVAGYGWYQYFVIPPWDAFWLRESGMIGYMGIPEPTKMSCFSTLNERGPCAGFLTWAVVPMLLSPRWRNVGGWLSVLLLLSAMLLTEVRSGFIIVALTVLLQPILSRGRGAGGLLVAGIVITLGAVWGLEKIPGVERFTRRFETTALAGHQSSAHVRLQLYASGVQTVLHNPLGLGLGSSGMATQRNASDAAESVFDAGYIQIIAQFGWVGAMAFFGGLALLWREVSARWRRATLASARDPFLPATRAVLLATLVLLVIADTFSGFSLIWIIFGCAIRPMEIGRALPSPRLGIDRAIKPRSPAPSGSLIKASPCA